ncbi:cytochrome P450 2F5-like isoform X2 [Haemaphysalis longicornis]
MDIPSVATILDSMVDWRCILFSFICILYWLLLNVRKFPAGKKIPPGPLGLPLLGHLHNRANLLDYRKCMELAKTYGSVFRLRMGMKDVIILNDFHSIKEVLSMKEILFRSETALVWQVKYKGLNALNGDAWRDNRHFCMHMLRDLGFGKKSMQEHIKEEVNHLTNRIAEQHGRPILIDKLLEASVANNISALVFGRRFPFEDPVRAFFDSRNDKLARVFATGAHYVFFPRWIFYVRNLLPSSGARIVKEVYEEIATFISGEVENHETALDDTDNRDFIDGYLKKIKEDRDSRVSNFKMDYLVGNAMSFFGAGTHTVKATLLWHLLNLADKVNTVQKRIQEEVDRVTGGSRPPRWEDQDEMPFTVATIWEMYRWRAVSPLSLPREAAGDAIYKDFVIPKGSVVIPNLGAVHMDPELWDCPEKFRPERYLTNDGKRLKPKPELVIPFSTGKRMCPGATLATVEIFLYLTTLLQEFNVLPVEGRRIDLESISTAVNFTRPQELRFEKRHGNKT